MGIVGAAVGFRMYYIAVVLSLVNLLTLRWLFPLKQGAGRASTSDAGPISGDDGGR